MGMSIPYTETGRTQQKARTRSALVDAARALIERGITPTVEEAAGEAAISRTTAYRYFPNQRELLVAAHPHLEAQSLLGDDPSDDPEKRLQAVLDTYLEMTVENELALRAAFVLSATANEQERHEFVLRQGRVVGWVQDALAPLHGVLSQKRIHRLACAIRAAAGIEAMIWLVDVAGMRRTEAVKLMKWSAIALLRTAVAEAGS